MAVTCQLVRVGPTELPAIRTEPVNVLELVDGEESGDRWADLDQAWEGLFDAFEAGGDRLGDVLFPSAPVADESEHGGPIVMLGEPDVVRSVAEALDGFQPGWRRRRRWPRPDPKMEPEYLQAHLEVARDFYRRAAAAGDAIAVIIG